MSDYEKLAAEPRTTKGKEVKRLRRVGVMPGIIYGPAIDEPQMIGVSARDFDVVYQRAGASSLIDLTVGTVEHTVFIRGVDRDPIKNQALHAEFYAPNLNKVTEVTVALMTIGEPTDTSGGVLNHGRTDVLVRGLPTRIPQYFEVDLTTLAEVDAVIHVSDLAVPEGVEILTPGDEVIVRLSAAQRASQADESAAAETEAEESGAAAETTTDD